MLELEQIPFATVKYLNEPLSKKEITQLLKKLRLAPIELVRQKETIWKEQYAGKQLTNDEIIDAIVKYPNLIERPIVVNGRKAVIARPAERFKEIL